MQTQFRCRNRTDYSYGANTQPKPQMPQMPRPLFSPLAVQGQSLGNTSAGSIENGLSGWAYVDYAASQGESFGQYC